MDTSKAGLDNGRLVQLDALRAFAVLFVMVEHYGGRAINALIPIGAGYLGVGLFFCLSGFLITSLLLQTFDAYGARRGRALGFFYARRFLRLAPPFYLTLLILVLVGLEPIASSWPWHAAYLTNIWIALGNPSNVFWSLAVEEQFYLLWPLAIMLTPHRYRLHLTIGTIIFGFALKLGWVLSGFPSKPATYLLFGNLALLGTGSLLGIVCYRHGRPFQWDWLTPQRERLIGVVAAAAALAALGLWFIEGRAGILRFLLIDILLGLSFIWLILGAARGWGGVAGMVMSNPVILFIGRISYGLYLTHNFVPKILLQSFGPMEPLQLLALTLPITFMVCTLSWFLMERPLLSLRRHFPDRPPRAT